MQGLIEASGHGVAHTNHAYIYTNAQARCQAPSSTQQHTAASRALEANQQAPHNPELLRVRLLFKGRSLIGAPSEINTAYRSVRVHGLRFSDQRERAAAAAPSYLRWRVQMPYALPRVEVKGPWDDEEDGARDESCGRCCVM